MKKCILCDEELSLDSFYLKDKKTNRYDSTCKECRKQEASEWHLENHAKSIENKKITKKLGLTEAFDG